MIINGGSRSNAAFFAKHLKNPENNERVTLAEIRGLAAKDIGQAFYEMKAVASGTRCKNFFYHANLNPRDDEHLTPEQWDRAVDVLEKELGLEDHARFVVEHDKNGRVHRHVVWSRIDVDRMTAVKMHHDYAKHQAVARQLEREFGLEPGRSVLGPEAEKGQRPERRPKQWEVFRGQSTGIDVRAMKEEITELWDKAKSAEAFISELEAKGYVLARGDSRAYCIVDSKGDVHSLARRIGGVKAADVRERLSAVVDPKDLPHVSEASAYQREQAAAQEQEQEWEEMPQAVAREESGERESVLSEEQQQAERQVEQAREMEQQQAALEKQAAEAREREQHHALLDSYKQNLVREAEEARRLEAEEQKRSAKQEEEREKQERAQKEGLSRFHEGSIRDAHSRYGQALAQHYNILNPYETLARSAMAEHGAYLRDRERLDQQIAKATDPLERQGLELRKRIERAEYMAITSRRIAGQSEVIVGRKDTDEAIYERSRADAFTQEAQTLRKELRELGREKEQGPGQGISVPVESGEKEQQAQKTAPVQKVEQQGKQERSSFMVEERTTGKPRGPEQNLTDFLKELPEKEPVRTYTKEEARTSQEARKARIIEEKDKQNRNYAVENISRDIKAKKNLNSNDIRRLSREDRDAIRRNGDMHLKDIVQQHDKEREKGRGLER